MTADTAILFHPPSSCPANYVQGNDTMYIERWEQAFNISALAVRRKTYSNWFRCHENDFPRLIEDWKVRAATLKPA